MPNTSPVTAWKALKEGNERFVAGRPQHPSQSVEHRTSLAAGQKPTAVVFGCADSRVAAGTLAIAGAAYHLADGRAALVDHVGDIGE